LEQSESNSWGSFSNPIEIPQVSENQQNKTTQNQKSLTQVNIDNLADFIYQYDAYYSPVSSSITELYSDIIKALRVKND